MQSGLDRSGQMAVATSWPPLLSVKRPLWLNRLGLRTSSWPLNNMDLNCGSTLHVEFFIDHSVQTRAVTSAVGGHVQGGPTVVICDFQLHRRLEPQPPPMFKSHLYSRPLCPWGTPPALLPEDGHSLCSRFSSSQAPLRQVRSISPKVWYSASLASGWMLWKSTHWYPITWNTTNQGS